MTAPFLGEIRMFAGNYAPQGWALCNGQVLAISDNDALFNLIGTIYGGDGQSTFALPDLQGRFPVHAGPGYSLGMRGGAEAVTLTPDQMPSHSHSWLASAAVANESVPTQSLLAQSPAASLYIEEEPGTELAAATISPAPGGSGPHENVQPYLCVSFILALFGQFPSHA